MSSDNKDKRGRGPMHQVKRQSLIVVAMAFVLILILSAMYSRESPPLGLYVSFVIVSLVVANLLALLVVQVHRFGSESVIDPLTGVHNRRYLTERLQQEIHRCERMERPLAVLFIDLDDFKGFNDRYGHAAGDQALKRVAHLLSSGCFRQMDLLTRYGGEEFAVVLPEVDVEAAAAVAERIRKLIHGSTIDGAKWAEFGMSLTVGVAACRPGETATDLLQRADQAMYEGKARGKNQTFIACGDTKASILVVEDDASIRELCSRVLVGEGYAVDTAATGDAALELIGVGGYRLVISDMSLPDMTGLDVLRTARGHGLKMPALCISGSLSDTDKSELRSLGSVEFLPKPFEIRELVERVNEAVARQDAEE